MQTGCILVALAAGFTAAPPQLCAGVVCTSPFSAVRECHADRCQKCGLARQWHPPQVTTVCSEKYLCLLAPSRPAAVCVPQFEIKQLPALLSWFGASVATPSQSCSHCWRTYDPETSWSDHISAPIAVQMPLKDGQGHILNCREVSEFFSFAHSMYFYL